MVFVALPLVNNKSVSRGFLIQCENHLIKVRNRHRLCIIFTFFTLKNSFIKNRSIIYNLRKKRLISTHPLSCIKNKTNYYMGLIKKIYFWFEKIAHTKNLYDNLINCEIWIFFFFHFWIYLQNNYKFFLVFVPFFANLEEQLLSTFMK